MAHWTDVMAMSVSALVTCITGHTPPMSHKAIISAASDFIRRRADMTSASVDAAATSATALSIRAAT